MTARRSRRDTPTANMASSPERVRSGPSHVSAVNTKCGCHLPRHATGHQGKGALALVGIEARENEKIAVGCENTPRRHDLMSALDDPQRARQLRQHQVTHERHGDSLEIVAALTL